MTILYLHGFNSDGSSATVTKLRKRIKNLISISYDYIIPDNAYVKIDVAIKQILIEDSQVILVGTSLGGFWANFFAQKYKFSCVLINPSTSPWLSLFKYVGINVNFNSGKERVLTKKNVDDYKKYKVEIIPGILRYVVLATNDCQLDYRVAEEVFKKTSIIELIDGGHRIQNADYIANIIIKVSLKGNNI
jgi:uncharacterized protein